MKKLSLLFLLALPWVCSAADIRVEGVRTWQAPDNTRVVFDVSSADANYRLFRLANPPRLVIDFKNTRLTGKVLKPAGKDLILKNIRSATRRNSDLRVVLDLHDKTKFKSFFLKPYQQYGHRLVVDLLHGADQQQGKNSSNLAANRGVKKALNARGQPLQPKLRDLVIAIDAGHGGEDPGAHGPRGTNEKDVVFAIARKLAVLIEKEEGMRPLMIRDGDYYLSLRQRTRKARDNRADMFISIHADAFRDKRVYGTSVYILSENGATSEAARWLAEKENASDLIGGVSLDDKDNMLARVLLDLSQTATKQASFEAGREILHELKPLGKLHKRKVQQAAFAVLKSPDIPSILVETAFISNPNEERKLRSHKHQAVLAKALLKGVRGYFTKNAPPGTLYAMRTRKHVIARGDTLSEIAQRYHVSIATIRAENKLSGDRVSVGQVLRIPALNAPARIRAEAKARKHVIARGDTLSGVAQRYDVSIATIRTENKLSGDRVRVGQVLRIPALSAPARTRAVTKVRRHVIARGDTLSGVAQRYHVSIATIRAENKLSGDRVRVGQVLRIPALNTAPATLYAMSARKHVIARGDTLSEIAQRYHVSIASIRSENKLSGDRVSVGQVLRIPTVGDG